MAKPPRLDEFQRIARFFAPLAGPGALGLQDDVALIDGPSGTQYVLKTDAIVEGVHFFPDDPPNLVAQKLLRVNLSDLAAKGAEPVCYLLTIALTARQDEAWLKQFSVGLAADQKRFSIALLGGDSVRTTGAATLSAAVIGRVTKGRAPRRSGARPGDAIYMSGTLGDAALGLQVLKGELRLSAAHRKFLVDRYGLPQPRLALGRKIARLASASMDISDGLVADLGHICDASKVAAVIETTHLPLSLAARAALKADPSLLLTILTGGDDYEILFTAPPSARAALAKLPVTQIGGVEKGRAVTVLDASGKKMSFKRRGYSHF
jgi:thiamine-monophosphate kinase